MIKNIKYVAMMLLATLAMVSCGELKSGSVGDTTVYFSNEAVNDGFSAGYVYVPIRMDMGKEANTANVNVEIEVLDVQNAEQDVDFLITSQNLVFQPGVDSIAVEIKVIPNIDEFDLLLGIANANTDVDAARKECAVHVEKNTRDRLCDDWTVAFANSVEPYYWKNNWNDPNEEYKLDVDSPITMSISWSIVNGCFEAWVSKGLRYGGSVLTSVPFYMNFIDTGNGKELMTIPTYKQVDGPYDLSAMFESEEAYKAYVEQYGIQADWTVHLYQNVALVDGKNYNLPTEDELELEYDVQSKTKTIRFKDTENKYALYYSYELIDGSGRRQMTLFPLTSLITNPVFTCEN